MCRHGGAGGSGIVPQVSFIHSHTYLSSANISARAQRLALQGLNAGSYVASTNILTSYFWISGISCGVGDLLFSVFKFLLFSDDKSWLASFQATEKHAKLRYLLTSANPELEEGSMRPCCITII